MKKVWKLLTENNKNGKNIKIIKGIDEVLARLVYILFCEWYTGKASVKFCVIMEGSMVKIMNFLNKLERKIGKYAIPNIGVFDSIY